MTLGFVAAPPGATIAAATAADAITVYVPTAPNPTSGYVLVVRPAGDVREVDISVDDALKVSHFVGRSSTEGQYAQPATGCGDAAG